jgi:hypothetical protein
MQWLFRLTVGTLLMSCLLRGVAYFQPDWLDELDLQFWRLPEYQEALVREDRRKADLEALFQTVLDHSGTKSAVGRELVAGRMTLAEATERFRELFSHSPGALDAVYLSEQGRTKAERLCRHTIRWVQSTLNDRPAEAREVGRRLEAQLDAYLERYGTVPLPQPSS